jgi:hypothetical protein
LATWGGKGTKEGRSRKEQRKEGQGRKEQRKEDEGKEEGRKVKGGRRNRRDHMTQAGERSMETCKQEDSRFLSMTAFTILFHCPPPTTEDG